MFTEIDALLLQSSQHHHVQALRARKGDQAPNPIPNGPALRIEDGRLPIARLS